MARPSRPELVQIKIRAKDELRSALQAAADAKGTSLNSEIIDRLERSLENETKVEGIFVSPVTAAVAKMMAAVMHEAGRAAGFAATFTIEESVDWFRNAFAFDQAAKAANRVIEALRPEGAIKQPPIPAQFKELGVGLANTVLEEAVTGKSVLANGQDRAEMLHRELGPLAETIRKNLRKGKGR
jgi:Arc-like DNA binding dprotein